MRMFPIPVALALVALATGATHAQKGKKGGPPTEPRPPAAGGINDPDRWYKLPPAGKGDRFTPILAKMTLEKKQIAKLRPFLTRADNDRKGVLGNKKLDAATKKVRLAQIDDQVYRLVDIVLNKEQKPIFLKALQKTGYVAAAPRP